MNKYGRKLESWSMTQGPYDAPELQGRLQGISESGKWIVTSRITKAQGRIVITESGSEYELGEVDPNYLAYLRSQDYQFDPEHPIALVHNRTKLPPPTCLNPNLN